MFGEALALNPMDDLTYAALGYCAEVKGEEQEALRFYRTALRLRPYWRDILKILSVKFLIIPLLAVLILHLSGLRESYSLLASFLVIEAAAAPATAFILQVRHYGGDEQKIGSLMLISYICCALALPFWLAVWHALAA